MSDLSQLLGAVYGDPSDELEVAAAQSAGTARAGGGRHRTFADWLPGPGPEVAPPSAARQPVDDDLAAALSAALDSTLAPAAPPEPAPADAAPARRTVPLPPLVTWDQPAPAPPATVAPAPVPVPVVAGPRPAPVAVEVPGPTPVRPAALVTWAPGNDDIVPGRHGRIKRGRRR